MEASEMFDNKVAMAEADFMDAMTAYMESCMVEDNFFVEKKKETDSLVTKTKKFFANLVAAFQNFIATIQVELDRKVRSAEFKSKLRKLHTELKEGGKGGIREVEVHDVWSMSQKYTECVNDLKKYAKKFANMKYKHVKEIDDDTEDFNRIMENYKAELEAVSKKTVVVPINKMINFVEDEISGRSHVMAGLNDVIAILQQMNKDCELIEKRRDILGPDIIPKHIGLLRRFGKWVTGLIKPIAVKFITNVAFLVG
jgi:hypothetical protein